MGNSFFHFLLGRREKEAEGKGENHLLFFFYEKGLGVLYFVPIDKKNFTFRCRGEFNEEKMT